MWYKGGLLAVMVATSCYFYPRLPEQVPTHWNIQGEVDAYSSKEFGAWFLPVFAGLMIIIFEILPKIDPKKEKYALFKPEWSIIQAGLLGFFAYLHMVMLWISVHPEKELLPYMFGGLGALFVLLGNYLSKIRQNYFLGIKVPWTLNNEENWNKTHRFASWWFVGAGLLTLLVAVALAGGIQAPELPIIVFGGMMLAVVIPIGYSYLLFKKQKK